MASSIALALFLVAPSALPSTWTVDNTCSDDINVGDELAHTGTLRFCVKKAANGDVVDLSQTTCSQITLTTGAISIDQQQLTLHGADKNQTLVTGNDGGSIEPDRIFYASYMGGNVVFDHLTVSYGQLNLSVSGHANGGCIYSKGSVTLDNVGVYHCSATTTAASNAMALGGGVYAHALTIRNGSSLLHNGAYATQPAIPAQGGGAAAIGDFYLYDSVVALNNAIAPAGNNPAFGGGLELRGKSVITRALIAANHSSTDGGGIDLFTQSPTATAVITNSTISMNSAGRRTGGVETDFASTTLANSTIAFNTAVNYAYVAPLRFYSPGVAVNYRLAVGAPTLTLQSTIIADNTSGGIDNDLSAGSSAAKVVIAGADNLVRAFGSDITLPSGQGNISGVCPLLGPLRDNGNGSYTHALHSGSAGVGTGNNVVDDPITNATALYDQRGPDYLRVVNGLVDMGAYQRQQDNLFDAAFDGCP